MSQPIPRKNIEKAIVKGAKKVIAKSGLIPPTQSGNKELNHWATHLSIQSFPDVQAAFQFGESLGQQIVELSQAQNKQHLDGGVIRQLRSQKNVPTIPAASATTASVQSASAPVTAAPTTEPVAVSQPVVQPEPDGVDAIVPDSNISDPTEDIEDIEELEVPMANSNEKSVSIPVEQPESTEEAATVGAVEDDEAIPADPEAAKVELDPEPAKKSVPEEPKSVAETDAQEEAIAGE
ncbi:MAG: hypothetical protein NW224_13780 [Leptolyngbyaceae cyanobacterium bins.302]|nr:hypothetical protein [Leptolyngbyaceae cyanobacterium bins.302]